MTEEPTSTAQPVRKVYSEQAAAMIAFAAWLLPGLGHALMKMWARSLACLLCVGALVLCGAGMRGNLFAWETSDPFSRLGFVADAGSGVFYWVARWLETGGADVSHAA